MVEVIATGLAAERVSVGVARFEKGYKAEMRI